MNFRFNQKTVVHVDLKDIRKEIVQKKVGFCCGKAMTPRLELGIKTLICLTCGQYFVTQEGAETKSGTEDLDKKKVPYGDRSGAFYKAKMKEEIHTFLAKAINAFSLTEWQVMKIMDHYFAIRDHRIPRADPRKGLILACVHKITSIPMEYLGRLYGLEQRYITEGLKAYRRDLLPFEDFSLYKMVEVVFKRLELAEYKKPFELKKTVHEIVKLSVDFHVAVNTTVKTKVAGALYLLSETGTELEIETISKALDIGTTTIYKFYDQFIVALFEDFNENIKNRRDQLRLYLESRGIKIGEDFLKKRMDKYLRNN
jgi:hypothetical protein